MKPTKVIAFLIIGLGIGLNSLSGVSAVATATSTPTPTATARVRTAVQQQAAALEKAKSVALNIFNNHFLNGLAKVKTNVTNNAKLGQDTKTALISKIDTEIVWFTQKRDSVNGATTVAQVRAIVAEARVRYQTAAKDIRRLHISAGLVNSLEKVVTNLESNLLPKVQNFLDQLTAKGVDVQSEQALFNDAKTKVAAAKSEITLIRNSVTFEDAKSHFDLAKGYVKQTRELLKSLATSLKAKLPKTTTTVTPTSTVTPTTTPSAT